MARLTPNHNLHAVNPGLANEWHAHKNADLAPTEVTPGSTRKLWWLCPKGHEWEATIYNRSKGRGCPYCSGRKINEDNCLQHVKPEVAAQWHRKKNRGLTAAGVSAGSNRKVWWKCEKGHVWCAVIASRTRGSGCPISSGGQATEEYNLATIDPEVAAEWHPTRNGQWRPADVLPHSTRKLWWRCPSGHEWEAMVDRRSDGQGCPSCASDQGQYPFKRMDDPR